MNRDQRRKMGQRGPVNPLPINRESLKVHACECGCREFVAVQQLRQVPAVISPTGQPVLIAQELGARCMQCGAQARWAFEEQPKIVTLGGDGNVHHLSVESNLPNVEGGKDE